MLPSQSEEALRVCNVCYQTLTSNGSASATIQNPIEPIESTTQTQPQTQTQTQTTTPVTLPEVDSAVVPKSTKLEGANNTDSSDESENENEEQSMEQVASNDVTFLLLKFFNFFKIFNFCFLFF
jgi:hypothetical protein